ncbi:MAG: DUF1446 domain-containing protein [Deltaproteobacteria bacterium]|nr:DUF1446 domain-containing protein [Deltaproteobacteria bacterium]
MKRKQPLKIGNAGGYWGDDPTALKRQVSKGKLDYITIDFLAEITMSIMQKQFQRDPTQGYAYDFLGMIKDVLPQLLANKTRLITNAGGINPQACAKAILDLAKTMGLSPRIAVVYGDNILGNIDDLERQGANFRNMETGENFSHIRKNLEAANVYFGATPVVEALRRWQPDIIITGRVTDTGITLAPMIYEFGWELNDWDKLASGIIAGHTLECGAQATGGNFSDWELVENFNEIGFPIAEVNPDGSFVLTKHEETGGLVSVNTVREQVFYEMGDPKSYITPDVVADFSTIRLHQEEKNRVLVSGIRGYEPTPLYKISMAYQEGFRCSGTILISGPFARKKAERFASIFWKRWGDNPPFDEVSTEYVGWNSCHRSLGHAEEGAEILLRLGVRSKKESLVKAFRRMIAPLVLSGPPGVSVLAEGLGKVQSVIGYWPALISKELVTPKIALVEDLANTEANVAIPLMGSFSLSTHPDQVAESPSQNLAEFLAELNQADSFPLYRICLARSGDKGDTANIGVLARSEKAYAFLKEYLSAQRVKDWFQELCHGKVSRYSLDGLLGLNFLLEKSLGGGGSRTLRADAQGKTFSQAVLRQKVVIPRDVLNDVSSNPWRP